MDSLTDYIDWMSDFPISATGFRDADALVLCLLSYFDFSEAFRYGKDAAVLRDCRYLIDNTDLQAAASGKKRDTLELFHAAVNSERFGSLKITDYTDVLREEPPLQFTAVCFHDDSDLSFLAYRGTNSSLVGWHEDWMMAVSNTESQLLAKEYADKVIRPGRRWRIGGHSKGGNLALYAASLMEDSLLSLVERIYALDAPGFCKDVVNVGGLKRIAQKTVSILPEFSIVGKLFDPKMPDTRVIRSFADKFGQHSLITWGIEHGKPAPAEGNDSLSSWINEVLDRWIKDMNRDEYAAFVDELFEVLTSGGATTWEELEGWEGFERIRPNLQKVSPTTKRILADLPKQAILNSLPSLKQRAEKRAENNSRPGDEEKRGET